MRACILLTTRKLTMPILHFPAIVQKCRKRSVFALGHLDAPRKSLVKKAVVNFKKGIFLSMRIIRLFHPNSSASSSTRLKTERKRMNAKRKLDVITRLAPQSHRPEARKTASYHEGEKSILGSLWTDLNHSKTQGTVAEEPVKRQRKKY